jgi:HD-like signal output (HDOD) protein
MIRTRWPLARGATRRETLVREGGRGSSDVPAIEGDGRMKVRSALSPAEVIELHAEIDRRLTSLGVETQPAVAAKIISLIHDPAAGLRQYADVLRNDVAISGRLLRLSNSALFGQVQAVTTLERACVLLGLQRLKAVSLGFYLSRAAGGDPAQVLSRRVWGESVLRACLAGELARVLCPGRVAEAFIVGLMLDCGMPLQHRMLGAPAERVLSSRQPPPAQFKSECETLPFTHVDVAAALIRRWRLPELLSRPIESHHTGPGDVQRPEAVHVLHRIAYCVGSVSLTQDAATAGQLKGIARDVLRLSPDALARAIHAASDEYTAIRAMFRDVADECANLAGIAESVHAQLLSVMDKSLVDSLRDELPGGPTEFNVGGHRIEVEAQRGGRAVAYLRDEHGERIVSHSFNPGRLTAGPLLDALGLDPAPADQTAALERHLRSLAA